MKWHRILAVIYRHAYEGRRNFNRITETFYWPIQNILLWGLFTVYLSRQHGAVPGIAGALLGAVMLWGMFYTYQRDIAASFMEELWSRNMLNLFSTPLTITEYMVGLMILNFSKAVLGLLLAALIGWFCYAYNIFPELPAFLPFLFNLVLFALTVSLLITGLMIRYSTKIYTLAWSFAGILMPFSCIFYPVDTLPVWLRPVALSLPTTRAFEGMRLLLAHGEFSVPDFLFGLALNLVYFLLAILFFRRMFAIARSKGYLVKQP
jgi:ABC-2 type transport system permease protein